MRTIGFGLAVGGLFSAATAQSLLNNQLYYTTPITGLNRPVTFEWVDSGTMLIAEKDTGRLKRYVNNVYQNDAIDLAVANEGEMGLLGVVKDPNFGSNNFIYIFYSGAAVDGGAWVEDRLVRYTYNGSTLDSPVTLWVMGPTAQFPATEIYHHGGYIRIGPDNKLYLQRGDMLRWGSIEMNYQNPNLVGTCGSIYRLNLDGSAPSDNPFFSHPNESIRKIWVYGFRNGYGMSWDRSTGELWFSENGPTVYDEINIARPGMNSGWRLIMGPDARNAAYPNNGNQPWNANQLFYFTGAEYFDPVFSYLNPVGLSGLEFFRSTRYLESSTVFDNVLIGCTNTQQIYMLPVSANRMGVNGTGTLADLVADNAAERDLWALGNTWGIITDARIGPDGYMYLSDWLNGRIHRLRPKADAVFPFDINLVRGVPTGGNVTTSLEYPDDIKLNVRPGITFTTAQAPVLLECYGTSPFPAPASLNLVVEASATSPAIDMIVEVYNFNKATWQTLPSIDLTTTDTKYTVGVPGTPSHFVQAGTNEMRARVSMKASGPVFAYPWTGNVDMVHWTSVLP